MYVHPLVDLRLNALTSFHYGLVLGLHNMMDNDAGKMFWIRKETFQNAGPINLWGPDRSNSVTFLNPGPWTRCSECSANHRELTHHARCFRNKRLFTRSSIIAHHISFNLAAARGGDEMRVVWLIAGRRELLIEISRAHAAEPSRLTWSVYSICLPPPGTQLDSTVRLCGS